MGSMRVWKKRVWESKNLEKNRKNQKKTKKTILHGLTQDSSHRIGFFGFFGFLRVFGPVGLGEQKTSRKTKKKTKKNKKKTILHGLTQDSSHRIVFFGFFCFFGFLRVFGQVGLGEQKSLRKTKKTKKNNFAWTYPRFFSQDCFGKLGMEKKAKNKICKNPTLPASVSDEKIPNTNKREYIYGFDRSLKLSFWVKRKNTAVASSIALLPTPKVFCPRR